MVYKAVSLSSASSPLCFWHHLLIHSPPLILLQPLWFQWWYSQNESTCFWFRVLVPIMFSLECSFSAEHGPPHLFQVSPQMPCLWYIIAMSGSFKCGLKIGWHQMMGHCPLPLNLNMLVTATTNRLWQVILCDFYSLIASEWPIHGNPAPIKEVQLPWYHCDGKVTCVPPMKSASQLSPSC